MTRKPLASAAVLLLLLIVPLLDGIASASARGCGKAPCCAGKLHCPMHRNDAERSSCSFDSCGDRDVSLAAMPPIIDCEANELRYSVGPAALMIDGETAAIIDRSAPPDPPPPRRLG